MYTPGFDLSHWDGTAIWKDVPSDLKFMFTKFTEGTWMKDSQAFSHWVGAGSRKILRGGYHFWRYSADARAQAKYFKTYYDQVTGGVPSELPPVIDIEDPQAPRMAPDMRKRIQAMLTETQLLFGRQPIIYCVSPDTPVFLRNLTWKAAGDLLVDDRLIGFDEYNSINQRRLAEAKVSFSDIQRLPAYNVYLSDGTVLCSTPEHRWLVRGQGRAIEWCRTDHLQDRLDHHLRTLSLDLPKFFSRHDRRNGFDAGYVAAAFDGEGNIRMGNNNGMSLHMAQKPNSMLENVQGILRSHGYKTSISTNLVSDVDNIHVLGGRPEIMRFLQEYRPLRLLDNFAARPLDTLRLQRESDVSIEAVEYLGEIPMARISSTSQTYIASGFGAHNTAGWWTNVWVGDCGFLKGYPLWIADYTYNSSGAPRSLYFPKGMDPKDWKFWQYSDKAEIPGVPESRECVDVFNGSMSELLAFCGVTEALTLEEKVDRLVAAHPELFPELNPEL